MTSWFWGVLGGLVANEVFQLSGWAAQKLVRWSARIRYEDPERAEIRAEELASVIKDRPGELFKLITAICFVLVAARAWAARAASRMSTTDVTLSSTAVARITVVATTAATLAAATALTLTAVRLEPMSTPQISAPVLQGKSVADVETYARTLAAEQGWGAAQFACLIQLWTQESGWRYDAQNTSSGAYGVPQALPGSKMGVGWQTNPPTQVKWGLGYVKAEYGSPCRARNFEAANGYY